MYTLLFFGYSVFLIFVFIGLSLCAYEMIRIQKEQERVQNAQWVVKRLQKVRMDSAEEECIICLNQYKLGEEVVRLGCNQSHCFHFKCLSEWIKTGSCVCPICREPVDV